jgi:hypothetical protein
MLFCPATVKSTPAAPTQCSSKRYWIIGSISNNWRLDGAMFTACPSARNGRPRNVTDELQIISKVVRFIEDVLQNEFGSVSDWESTSKSAALEKPA